MTDLIYCDGNAIAESLAGSLEAMAFISAAPAEAPYEVPAEPVLIRIAFTGPICAALEMMAPRGFGAVLLSNVTGDDPSSVSAAQAEDALKELMNVVCGAMLRGTPGAVQFEISLPTVNAVQNNQAWADFVSFDGTVVIDAEGHLIAVRMAPCF